MHGVPDVRLDVVERVQIPGDLRAGRIVDERGRAGGRTPVVVAEVVKAGVGDDAPVPPAVVAGHPILRDDEVERSAAQRAEPLGHDPDVRVVGRRGDGALVGVGGETGQQAARRRLAVAEQERVGRAGPAGSAAGRRSSPSDSWAREIAGLRSSSVRRPSSDSG